MWAWWDSLHIVSLLNWISRCAGATFGVLIVLFSLRESTLNKLERQREKRESDSKIATAQLQAADTQQSFREVRDRIQARHFTEEQEATLLSLINDAPTGTIRVHYAEQDGEAQAFADQIVATMKKAHWYVQGHESVAINHAKPHPTEDLVFDVPPNSPPPASLQPLRDALAKIGFSSGTRDLGSADGVVDLFVGTKRARE